MRIGPLDLSRLKLSSLRCPDRLGLEIGGRSVRIVKMKKGSKDAPIVDAYGELDIDIRGTSIIGQQRLRSAIRQLGGGIVRVAANIEHPTLRIRRMCFPRMPEQDLMEAIRWNFREQVEGAIENYVVGYTPLEGIAEGNKAAIMAYGVSQEAVREHVALLKTLGLKPISLEPTASALFAAFYANGILSDGRHHVCVAFGDVVTQFIVMKGKSMLFSRPLAGISGESLVKLVMRNLNIEEKEARDALSLWVERPSGGQAGAELADSPDAAAGMHRIETTMGHFLSQLVIEVQRSIDAFCIMYGIDRVEDMSLCGTGVLYPGLVAHMRKTLGIDTRVFNPFERLMELARQTEDMVRRAPFFAVAVGLAIP